jgi:hypothetical protein
MQVFINRVKFCEFNMRSKVEDIRAIQITGDVIIHKTLLMMLPVCLHTSHCRLFSSLKFPFTCCSLSLQEQPIEEQLPYGLQVGSWIIVRGIPKECWTRYGINRTACHHLAQYRFQPIIL